MPKKIKRKTYIQRSVLYRFYGLFFDNTLIRFLLLAAGILLCTFMIGRLSADFLRTSPFSAKGRIIYLLGFPANEMARIRNHLASSDPLVRSAGYYGMLESGTVDPDFLEKQYYKEDAISVQLSILYVLHNAGKKGSVERIRAEAPESIRHYIDTTLIRNEKPDVPTIQLLL